MIAATRFARWKLSVMRATESLTGMAIGVPMR